MVLGECLVVAFSFTPVKYYGGKFDVLFSLWVRRGFAVGSLVVRWWVDGGTLHERRRLACGSPPTHYKNGGGSPTARRRHTRGTAAARLRLAADTL